MQCWEKLDLSVPNIAFLGERGEVKFLGWRRDFCTPVNLTLRRYRSGRSGHVVAAVVASYILRSGRSGRINKSGYHFLEVVGHYGHYRKIGGHYNGRYVATTATTNNCIFLNEICCTLMWQTALLVWRRPQSHKTSCRFAIFPPKR